VPANFITGPNYLLNGGMRVADMIDVHAVRRQAIAFTNLILQPEDSAGATGSAQDRVIPIVCV
jgi:hypothetical protein